MSLTREPVWEGEPQAGLYCPKYREGYTAIHSTDVYWTAERVLGAPERFRVILAVDTGEVVGYIDITTNYDENEPFDVFVKESAGQGNPDEPAQIHGTYSECGQFCRHRVVYVHGLCQG